MSRVPQVMLTLAPDGTIVAEFPTTNGLRRHVPIDDDTGMASIRRILAAQLGNRPTHIGTDAKPTVAQITHWQKHLAKNHKSESCPWCIAQSLGIDTSESAYKRARAQLQEQRKASNRRPYNYAGDGTVKVYKPASSGKKATRVITNTMLLTLLADDED